MTTTTSQSGVSLAGLWCGTHELTNCAYCGARNEHEVNREIAAHLYGRDERHAPQRTFAVVPVPTSRPLPPRTSHDWAPTTHQIPRAPLSAWHVLPDPVETGNGIATRDEIAHG